MEKNFLHKMKCRPSIRNIKKSFSGVWGETCDGQELGSKTAYKWHYTFRIYCGSETVSCCERWEEYLDL